MKNQNAVHEGDQALEAQAKNTEATSGGDENNDESGISGKTVRKALGAAGLAAVIVSIVLLAFSWPTVTSDAKDLPVATVGPEEQVDKLLSNAPEGLFDTSEVDSREDAVTAIQKRDVYGAFVFDGADIEILVSSAASPAVSGQLETMGTKIQAGIDKQTIEKLQSAMAAGGSPQAAAAAQAQTGAGQAQAQAAAGQSQGKPVVPTVTTTDVVPLSDEDPNGAGLAIAGFPLTFGGIIGGLLIALGVKSYRLRAVAIATYMILGGLALTLILQTWFELIQGSFGLNWMIAGLSVGATAALINGLQSILGAPGIGLGAMITILIGTPIAGISAPKEFLPGAWGDIGQYFVPGSTGTLLRTQSYFPEASMAAGWWTLIAWAVVGFALLWIGHLIKHSKQKANN